jgi:hypothetical protein
VSFSANLAGIVHVGMQGKPARVTSRPRRRSLSRPQYGRTTVPPSDLAHRMTSAARGRSTTNRCMHAAAEEKAWRHTFARHHVATPLEDCAGAEHQRSKEVLTQDTLRRRSWLSEPMVVLVKKMDPTTTTSTPLQNQDFSVSTGNLSHIDSSTSASSSVWHPLCRKLRSC